MTVITEVEPGEVFAARDGNYNHVTDAQFPMPGEPTDFVLDSEGQEVRKGDYLLVLKSGWSDFADKVVRVTGVERARMYPATGNMDHNAMTRGTSRAWSPSSPLNQANIVLNTTSTSISPLDARKVNLSADDTLRLQLAEMYESRSRLDERASKIEAERTTLNIRIREHRQALGEID